jgi:hypothetical protein
MNPKKFTSIRRKLYGLVYRYNGREGLLSYENVPVLFSTRGIANEAAKKKARVDGLQYRAVALDVSATLKFS